ncbi:MAG: anthranilate synthase component I family protein [Planctomycetota bacterium]
MTNTATGIGRHVLELRVRSLEREVVSSGLDVPGVLARLRGRPGLAALESAGGSPRRWSIVAFDPVEDFAASDGAPRTLDELQRRLAAVEVRGDVPPGPFGGGFLGGLSYEVGVRGESQTLPAPAWPQPPIAGGLYGSWIVVEHDDDGGIAAAHLVTDSGTEDAAEFVLGDLSRPAPARAAVGAGPAVRHVEPDEHRARIEAARALIAEGEIYQANLAHRLTAPVACDALDLYLALRETNPAPYMGLLPFASPTGERGAVVSSSPELLLQLDVAEDGGRIARTRPIKGTAPRGSSPAEDEALGAALLASRKDLGELAMIVDLERNDLGRIALPGAVHVEGFPTLQRYPAVQHLVADVVARVRPGLGSIDVLASLFPGGSITGAPKLRSMEAIAEIEGEGRGYFTGALGFADARGRAAFNVLIRTIVHRERPEGGREVSFHVGSGVTWSSDAAAEDRETMLKAERLLAALRG